MLFIVSWIRYVNDPSQNVKARRDKVSRWKADIPKETKLPFGYPVPYTPIKLLLKPCIRKLAQSNVGPWKQRVEERSSESTKPPIHSNTSVCKNDAIPIVRLTYDSGVPFLIHYFDRPERCIDQSLVVKDGVGVC